VFVRVSCTALQRTIWNVLRWPMEQPTTDITVASFSAMCLGAVCVPALCTGVDNQTVDGGTVYRYAEMQI
jgi:hypothetical protein